jgi:hypothetical protein
MGSGGLDLSGNEAMTGADVASQMKPTNNDLLLKMMMSSLGNQSQTQQPVVAPSPATPMMAGSMGGMGMGGGAAGGKQINLPSILSPQQIMTALELLKQRMGAGGIQGLGTQSNVPRF